MQESQRVREHEVDHRERVHLLGDGGFSALRAFVGSGIGDPSDALLASRYQSQKSPQKKLVEPLR